MKEQGKGVRGRLDPLPQIKPYEPFAYNAFDLPDPFKPRKIEPMKGEHEQARAGSQRGAASRSRRIRSSRCRWSARSRRARRVYALVTTPEKDIYQVRPGNYLGQNFGVIVGITDTEIKLKELMQDGAGDWTERSSTLNLLQADQKTQERRK